MIRSSSPPSASHSSSYAQRPRSPKTPARSIQQAQQTIDYLFNHWSQFSDPDRGILQPQVQSLQDLRAKVEQQRISIAAFGLVNRGKSAVLNALLGQPYFAMGPLNGVTHTHATTIWEPLPIGDGSDPSDPVGFNLELIDTPGLNEVEGAAREQLAWSVAQAADLILFVIAGDITQIEYQALLELRTLQKPILLVFNKIDLYPDHDRQAIYAQITSPRLREIVSPAEIVMVAAAPAAVKVRIHWPNQEITYAWEKPQPLIQSLQTRILEVLQQEGSELLALNTLLQAHTFNQQLIEQCYQTHTESARSLSWRIITAKALVAALSPIVLLDGIVGLGADLSLGIQLDNVYQLPFRRARWFGLVQRVGLSLGILLAAELGSLVLFHSPQFVAGEWSSLVIGLPTLNLSTYLGSASIQGLAAAASGHWLSQGLQTSWHDQSSKHPQFVIQQILTQLEPGSILSRLRSEVGSRLRGQS